MVAFVGGPWPRARCSRAPAWHPRGAAQAQARAQAPALHCTAPPAQHTHSTEATAQQPKPTRNRKPTPTRTPTPTRIHPARVRVWLLAACCARCWEGALLARRAALVAWELLSSLGGREAGGVQLRASARMLPRCLTLGALAVAGLGKPRDAVPCLRRESWPL